MFFIKTYEDLQEQTKLNIYKSLFMFFIKTNEDLQ